MKIRISLIKEYNRFIILLNYCYKQMRGIILIKKILLASSSPRRSQLLSRMGYDFDITSCDIDESFDSTLSPIDVARYLSRKKARVAHEYAQDYIVIGADTIVTIEGEILGKPGDIHEATSMLHRLKGNWHEVITGVTIIHRDREITQAQVTRVHFTQMTDDEISAYVNTTEPYDKAGGYGIQGLAGMYIDSIDGDFYNVMGFPMATVRSMLERVNSHE